MRISPVRYAVVLILSLSSLTAETIDEVLRQSAQVISGRPTFSGRGWGCIHNGAANGSNLLTAYEVLHRAPDDWLIVSMSQHTVNGYPVKGEGTQSFVYRLGPDEQKRGAWPEVAGDKVPADYSVIDFDQELNSRLDGDPFKAAVQYWKSASADPFEWPLNDAILLADQDLGGEPIWHVVGRQDRNQEVHLWFSKSSFCLIRSTVVERADGKITRISEWFYDQVFNPKVLLNTAFTSPRRIPYQLPLTVESMGLEPLPRLAEDFVKAIYPEQPVEATPDKITPVLTPAIPTPAASLAGGQKLTPQQMASIVLIESGDGQASGFLTKLRGVDFVVTNLHVLGDDPKLTVQNLNGEVLPVQGVFGAVGRDIAIIRVGASYGELNPMDDVLGEVQIGDEVVVVGNRQGGRVATQVLGKVLGIGPGRIEVDAPFEPGNSGSPVVHLKSGKVIGVATYSETRQIEDASSTNQSNGSKAVEKRWFAYRLDGITQWEAIDLGRWKLQYRQINEFLEDTESLYLLSQAKLQAGKSNPRIRPYIESFEGRFNRFASNSTGLVAEMQNFLGNLRGRGQSGVRELKSGEFYDYFRSSLYWKTNINDQLEFREWTLGRLEIMTRNVDGWRAQVRNGQGG